MTPVSTEPEPDTSAQLAGVAALIAISYEQQVNAAEEWWLQ